MVTQKAISLKIDVEVLEELDSECYAFGRKRNQIINRAIALYLRYANARRQYLAYGHDTIFQKEIIDDFIVNEFLLAPQL